jgi:hypothetical protein
MIFLLERRILVKPTQLPSITYQPTLPEWGMTVYLIASHFSHSFFYGRGMKLFRV